MNKKKNIMLASIILGVLVLTLGITYAVFTYLGTTEGNSQLVLGDIYMHYEESDSTINIDNMMPASFEDYINYYPNEVMKSQTIVDNELSRCINFFNEMGYNNILDEGSTLVTFCQGTGTMSGGYTLQQFWDQANALDGFMEQVGNRLVNDNVMILENNAYVINPVMTYQTIEENELFRCISYFNETEIKELLDDGSTLETYCQGTGTVDGNTIQVYIDDVRSVEYVIQEMLLQNIIVEKIEGLPYFEFTISGKNTYTKQDIYYELLLSYGNIPEDKLEENRIKDEFLRFRLVEIENGLETIIFNNYAFSDLKNQKIWTETIEKNTTSKISKTYRLYMWIDENVKICAGDVQSDCDYYSNAEENNWKDVFASIKVGVHGDFVEKATEFCKPATNSSEFEILVNNCHPKTKLLDTDGTIYLSGSKDEVNYNYVWYSGKLWRIIAINPDGTMKLITENAITAISWGEKATILDENLVSAYPSSWVREWLNQEFLPTLYNYENIIVTDYSNKEYKWNATTGTPYNTIEKITLLEDPVGLLNANEVKNTVDADFNNGYLIGTQWWSITPYSSKKAIGFNSSSSPSFATGTSMGIRPSVNLLSTVEFFEGDGTKEFPYKIKNDKATIDSNVTLLNTRSNGEYVKIENDTDINRVFRIIQVENGTTKLVTTDSVKDTNDLDADGNTTETLEKYFSSSTQLWSKLDETDETYWKGYLNKTWLKQLDSSYNEATGESRILAQGIYYLGYYPNRVSYKQTVCKTFTSETSIQECISNDQIVDNIWKGYVGLPRVGELFFSHSGSSSDSSNVLLITPFDADDSQLGVIIINDVNNQYLTSNGSFGARPTIHLKSEIVIKSGSGTKQDPFVVGLPTT